MGEKDNVRREIGALYGFRVLMTLLVANFHIWQQSWLPQTVVLLGKRISFDYITRTGYIFVDGLILLSATPDLYFTSITGTQEKKSGNNYPLLNAGKAVVREGKLVMPIAMTIHHGFIDGHHLSLFYKKVEEFLK